MRQPETRPSLIVRIKGGPNQAAWGDFVTAYEPFLRHLVQRGGVAPSDVSDVVQELLLTIARSVDRWEDDGGQASFRRWTSRVARNVVLKFLARRRREASAPGGSDWQATLEAIPDPCDELTRRYEHELIVWAALRVREDFRPTSWKAFWATLVEGRSVSEVASELGVTPGSIYMSRSRIMAKIRATLRDTLSD